MLKKVPERRDIDGKIYVLARPRTCCTRKHTCSDLVIEIFCFFFFYLSRSTMPCVSSALFINRSDGKEAFLVFGFSHSKKELLAN